MEYCCSEQEEVEGDLSCLVVKNIVNVENW